MAGRHDWLLLGGFAAALFLLFGSSIQYALDVARDIERNYRVNLLPALIILTVMVAFHAHASRRETQAEAEAAGVEARLARQRARELEQLMLFGQELAGALSTDALREAVWHHMPVLGAGSTIWVVVRGDSGWERLVDVGGTKWPQGEIEAAADAATETPLSSQDRTDGVEHKGHVCFVLHVGPRPVGVMGLPVNAASPEAHHTMAAAASVLTIAVRNTQLFAGLRDNSIKDSLTGCYSRGHAIETLENELRRSRRSKLPVSILLFDVDCFKLINDRFGHLHGDAVLTAVGLRSHEVLRRSDIRCRYGGDEFLVILPETHAGGAMRVAESLRADIEKALVTIDSEEVPFTISVGVATAEAGEMSPESLISSADRALYLAKEQGKNCVRSASDCGLQGATSFAKPVLVAAH